MQLEEIVSNGPPKIKFQIDQSVLVVDLNIRHAGMCVDDKVLSYRHGKYAYATPEFLDSEIQSHSEYLDALKKYQESLVTKFNKELDGYLSIKRVAQFVSGQMVTRTIKMVVSLANVPIYLFTRRSFLQGFKLRTRSLRRELRRYGYFARCAEYDVSLLKEAEEDSLSPGTQDKITELIDISSNIVYLHKDIYMRKRNELKHIEDKFRLFSTGSFAD